MQMRKLRLKVRILVGGSSQGLTADPTVYIGTIGQSALDAGPGQERVSQRQKLLT